jgi:hypothetical protein
MTGIASLPVAEVCTRLDEAILAIVADGTVLVGTVDTLARALSVTVTELRSALRELLESEHVTVQMEPRGQLSIRLDRRRYLPADRPI